MAGVPKRDRCICTPAQMQEWKKGNSFFGRIFGGSKPSA